MGTGIDKKTYPLEEEIPAVEGGQW